MTSKLVSLALVGAIAFGLSSSFATAAAERLTRPANADMNRGKSADGRIRADPDMRFGSFIANSVAGFGRQYRDPSTDKATMAAWRGLMCARSSATYQVMASTTRDALRALPKDVRKRLKTRDQASVTHLATLVVADLDGVDAEAIRDDEAIGPGAYHDVVEGVAGALEACDLFGQRP